MIIQSYTAFLDSKQLVDQLLKEAAESDNHSKEDSEKLVRYIPVKVIT